MDQTQLQQNIAKYYTKLPGDLQQYFSSMTWMEELKNISAKYSLDEEQIETLATETTLVLLSIIHLEDYVITLKKDLKLDEETFNKLLDDLDLNILKDIKDDLVNTFELNVEFLNNENTKDERISSKEQVVSSMQKIETSKNDDEVPLPPYGISSKEQVVSSMEDTSSIEKVVSSMDNQSSMQKVEGNKQEEKSEQKPTTNNNEELKYIPKNVFEDKIVGNTSSGHVVSDHSNPKIDPYREAF